MQEAVYRVLTLVSALVVDVPIGTNLGLLHLFWMVLCGKLLLSRGAIFPGLSAVGLSERGGAAGVGSAGAWELDESSAGEAVGAGGGGGGVLAAASARWVSPGRGRHHRRSSGPGCRGARPATTARRPGRRCRRSRWGSSRGSGAWAQQRFGLPRGLVRADPGDPSPSAHRRVLLKRAVELQEPTDVLVMDREFTVGQVQAAGATVWVTRLLKNMTARRADPPPYGGRGRPPKYGDLALPPAPVSCPRRYILILSGEAF